LPLRFKHDGPLFELQPVLGELGFNATQEGCGWKLARVDPTLRSGPRVG